MKISVLIIAHNEEEFIGRCLESILNQTQKPDEIVLIAHNCTDKTVEIAKKYPNIKLIEYSGPSGVTYARIKGFEVVSGDIICCIDSDAYATKNWIRRLTKPLYKNDIVLTCGAIFYTKSILPFLNSIYYFYIKRFLPDFLKVLPFYPYGPGFAIKKSTYEIIGGLAPFIKLRESLNIETWPDDAYLGLKCREVGKVVFVSGSLVIAVAKEREIRSSIARGKKDIKAGKILKKYFKL